MQPTECTLVSASCTTGWIDWIHGELWVCGEGLLRHALGVGATIAHGSGPTVEPSRPTRRFGATEIASAASGRNDRWVPWETIERAELRSGPLTDSLHIQLRGGNRIKFLWLRVDRASDYLAHALPSLLQERFVGRGG